MSYANTVERMAILTGGDLRDEESAPVEIRMPRDSGVKSNIREARESAEREDMRRALGLSRSA